MKSQILISLILISSVLKINAQWSGSINLVDNIWRNGSVGIGTSSNPLYKLVVQNGNYQFLIGGNSDGSGDGMMRINNNVGLGFAINSFSNTATYGNKLITNLGINYLINSEDSYTQYAMNGSKKSPIIRFDAEEGSISLFGENGSGGNYRFPSLNLGLYVSNIGHIGIGTTTPDSRYKLDVIGTIRAREIKVDLNGADFVFENEYKLMPLNELELFVKEHKHLPEIVSAKEMEKDGTDLGSLNSKLLQKMEEMTLYIIEQNKRIEILTQEVKELKKK